MEVYGFGNNGYSQLGIDIINITTIPILVSSLTGDFQKLVASYHALILLKNRFLISYS